MLSLGKWFLTFKCTFGFFGSISETEKVGQRARGTDPINFGSDFDSYGGCGWEDVVKWVVECVL